MTAGSIREMLAGPIPRSIENRTRRSERRFSVDQDGIVLAPGDPAGGIPVRIRNISSSGMQLEAEREIPSGCRIHIQWSGLTIDGTVCYQTCSESGFQVGVELFASWELLVSEILARQSEQLALAKNELELRNRELASALEAARLASAVKSRFLASVSHELRTPLNGIIGFAQMLFDGKLGAMEETQRECLGEVLGCSRHLLGLVSDLLDMSRIEAGRFEFRFEPVRLAEVVSGVVVKLKPMVDANRLTVDVECSPLIGEVSADPTRLRQVLYNYLSNAVKFTRPGGRIAVRLTPEGESDYRLEVEDSGPGIKREDLPRLFSEFGQLENCGAGGAGLGLALTKRIVEAQGGAVGVSSDWGSGSTFFAVLPRSPQLRACAGN